MTLDWTTAEYADSRKLAAWLEAEGHAERMGMVLGSVGTRILYRWRCESTTCELASVDRILAALGLHLSEVPDDVWSTGKPNRRGERVTDETRQAAVEEWRASGGQTKLIAQRYGVAARTVQTWVHGIGGGGVDSTGESLNPSAVASGVES